jgi:hypothetical protein
MNDDTSPQCDALYIDYNFLMHHVLKKCNFEDAIHDLLIHEVVISDIIAYTRCVIDATRPKKVVYLSINESSFFDSTYIVSRSVFMESFKIRVRSAMNLGLFKDVPDFIFTGVEEHGTGWQRILNLFGENIKVNIVTYGVDFGKIDLLDMDRCSIVTCQDSGENSFIFQGV